MATLIDTMPKIERRPRGEATVGLLLFLATFLLPRMPRATWMLAIVPARAANNYLMGLEQSLRAAPVRSLAYGGGMTAVALITMHAGLAGVALMPLAAGWTNFGGGVLSMGAPAADIGIFSPFGVVYFVDSGIGNTGNTGKRPTQPKATINQGIDATTASQGDVVVVAAGHAETGVANATTIVPDVAGITILGLGTGSERPTITLSNAAGNIPVSGANTRIMNLLVTVSGTTDVTSGITVTGADVQLVDVELRDGAATAQFAAGVTLGTGAARAKIVRLVFRGSATGDANTAAVSCAVALDGVEITDILADGLFANGGIYNVTTAMTNLVITRPVIRNRHATTDGGISVVATTTGYILSPRIRTATNDADGFNNAIIAAAMQVYDPLVVNADGERGGEWGTASAAA